MEKITTNMTPSKLRQNIYRVLDQVIETGQPVIVERKGKKIKIQVVEAGAKLARLTPQEIFNCDPDDIVHLDWSSEWSNDLP